MDLEVRSGRVMGLIGPNGAGKSTLLRLAAGLERPAAGSVLIEGRTTGELGPRALARRLAYVPQSFSLPFPFRVLEVVLQGRHPHLGRATFESSRDLEVARGVMERTGTWALRDRYFEALSGGERQRVVIAAALAQEPRLLILDEPTSALDLRFQSEVVGLMRGLSEAQGLSVLAAMHDLNLASIMCDELALLVDGELRAEGPPEQVLRREQLEPAYGTALEVGRTGDGRIYVLPRV